MPGGCAAIFESAFQSYYIFASVFFSIHQCLLLGQFYQYFHIFVVYYIEDVPLFLSQFFRATIFLRRFFFNSPMSSFGSILPIFPYFCCILCVFHQKAKQCFGHKFS